MFNVHTWALYNIYVYSMGTTTCMWTRVRRKQCSQRTHCLNFIYLYSFLYISYIFCNIIVWFSLTRAYGRFNALLHVRINRHTMEYGPLPSEHKKRFFFSKLALRPVYAAPTSVWDSCTSLSSLAKLSSAITSLSVPNVLREPGHILRFFFVIQQELFTWPRAFASTTQILLCELFTWTGTRPGLRASGTLVTGTVRCHVICFTVACPTL